VLAYLIVSMNIWVEEQTHLGTNFGRKRSFGFSSSSSSEDVSSSLDFRNA